MSDFTTHFATAYKFIQGKNFSEEFKQAFYFGVQGPDLFFYRTPASPGEGMKFGSTIHDKVPSSLFETDGADVFKESELYQGYYFGVLLHYFGDRQMHQYIGHLVKSNPLLASHIMYERDIDVYVYENLFKEDIRNFKVGKFYKYSKELNLEILKFWQKREQHPLVSEKDIKKCMKNIVGLAKLFTKPHKVLCWFLEKFEGKKNLGLISGHFKNTRNEEVMNLEHKEWECPTGVVNLSVFDFIEISMSDMEKEFKKIKEKAQENEKYTFDYNQTFSYGCEE